MPMEKTLKQIISSEDYLEYSEQGNEIGKLINYMINNPDKFGVKPK